MSGTTCPTSGFTTVGSTAVATAGTMAVSGLTVGGCYRFELQLNGATTAAATSGTILVVAAANADPARLSGSYTLTTSAALGSSAYVTTTESVAIVNNANFYVTTVNFSVLAQALGYNTINNVTVGGRAVTASWTTTTNLAVSVPPLAPGTAVTVVIVFNLTIPAGTGTSPFALRMNYSNGILILGNWFPIISRVHHSYGIGDPQVTWNAPTIDFTLTTSAGMIRDAVSASGELVSAPLRPARLGTLRRTTFATMPWPSAPTTTCTRPLSPNPTAAPSS